MQTRTHAYMHTCQGSRAGLSTWSPLQDAAALFESNIRANTLFKTAGNSAAIGSIRSKHTHTHIHIDKVLVCTKHTHTHTEDLHIQSIFFKCYCILSLLLQSFFLFKCFILSTEFPAAPPPPWQWHMRLYKHTWERWQGSSRASGNVHALHSQNTRGHSGWERPPSGVRKSCCVYRPTAGPPAAGVSLTLPAHDQPWKAYW